MRAKCRICKEILDTNTAHLVITNGKKAYYCSAEELEIYEAKKKKTSEDKDKVYRLICEIIQRKEVTNTALFAEWKIWNKVADNEKIGQYLEENKAYLCGAIAKLEDKEFNRIRYLSAILKNSLGDFKPKTEAKPVFVPKIQEEHYETKFKPKARKALLDFEEDCDE